MANDAARKVQLDEVLDKAKHLEERLNQEHSKYDDLRNKHEALVAQLTELKRKYSLLEEKHDELVQQKGSLQVPRIRSLARYPECVLLLGT